MPGVRAIVPTDMQVDIGVKEGIYALARPSKLGSGKRFFGTAPEWEMSWRRFISGICAKWFDCLRLRGKGRNMEFHFGTQKYLW